MGWGGTGIMNEHLGFPDWQSILRAYRFSSPFPGLDMAGRTPSFNPSPDASPSAQPEILREQYVGVPGLYHWCHKFANERVWQAPTSTAIA